MKQVRYPELEEVQISPQRSMLNHHNPHNGEKRRARQMTFAMVM